MRLIFQLLRSLLLHFQVGAGLAGNGSDNINLIRIGLLEMSPFPGFILFQMNDAILFIKSLCWSGLRMASFFRRLTDACL